MSDDAVISAVVRDVVTRLAPDSPGVVTESTLLRDELGYDSLALVELAFALEEVFELPPLPNEDAADVATAGDVEKLVVAIVVRGGLRHEEADLRAAVARLPERNADA